MKNPQTQTPNKNPKAITTIVLLGGGHVCIAAYRSLQKQLSKEFKQGDVRIKVVSPLKHYAFNGFIAESLTGIIQSNNRRSLLSSLIPKAEIIAGFAEEINNAKKVVHVRLQNGKTESIHFDYLLLGFGSVDSDAIAGVKEFGFQLKSQEGFEKAFLQISAAFKEALDKKTNKDSIVLNFVVAGAGFAGIEIASNLAEFIQQAKMKNPALRGFIAAVHLIVSDSEILPSLDRSYVQLRNYTLRTLNDVGVKIIYNTTVESISKNRATLSNGNIINTKMVISTIGQSQISLLGTDSMPRDILNRLITNEFLQIENFPRIWGGGDACQVRNGKNGLVCQSDALWAIKHGHWAGMNIARAIKGEVQKPFMGEIMGQTASLGIGKGITSLKGVEFTGLPAWCLRWVFFHSCIPSKGCLVGAMSDWVFLFVTGKRIRLYQV